MIKYPTPPDALHNAVATAMTTPTPRLCRGAEVKASICCSNRSRADSGTAAARSCAWRVEWRSVIVCAVLALAVACTAVLALMTGSYQLSPGQVVSALTGGETGLVHDIVVEWRLPRVAAALVFGAALGVSGAIFQSMLRNPLADPGIIGFSQGSYTGALIVILVVNGTYWQLVGGALLGGMATAVAVYLLAYRRGVQGFRLIIVGIGVSAMLRLAQHLADPQGRAGPGDGRRGLGRRVAQRRVLGPGRHRRRLHRSCSCCWRRC